MQVALFTTPSRKAAQQPEPEPVKRPRGRPPMPIEEKAQLAHERVLRKAEEKATLGGRGGPRGVGHGGQRLDGEAPGSQGGGSTAQTVKDYNESRATREKHTAAKEEVLAKKVALEFEIMQGNFLPRDSIISAMAKAFSTCSQGIRSIPDLLERRLGLDPVICVRIGEILDESLAGLHTDLEGMLMSDAEREAQHG